jgi:Flp pilus assembly protein TadG
MLLPRRNRRPATIVPLLALALVGLVGMVALAIDSGLIAIARNQCQNAADAAALAGVRTLTCYQSTNNNSSNVGTAVTNAATANSVLSQTIQTTQVQTVIGKYYYDSSQGKFLAYPLDSGSVNNASDNWTLVNATVSYAGQTMFAGVFGINAFNAQATATAIHRPIDMAILQDFSGSMRFSSLGGLSQARHGYYGPIDTPNNPESVVPSFGHYSSSSITLTQTTAASSINNYSFDAANITSACTTDQNRPAIVGNFYQQLGSSPVQAFTAASSSYATTPAGDGPLKINQNNGGSYAISVQDITGGTSRDANFETKGYKNYTGQAFNGYTLGPSYWGKTFFVWSPDPTNDWRKNFFFKSDGQTPVDDNNILWDSSGNWKPPIDNGTVNYYVNYQAIFNWLQNTGTHPFPSQMVAGYIQYYTAIPSGSDTTLNQRFWTQYPLTDTNERFWKDYIDWVLGNYQMGSNQWWDSTQDSPPTFTKWTGYGDDFSWTNTNNSSSVIYSKPTSGSPPPYMDYRDNPRRPLLHFWFGPMTMVDFLGSYNGWTQTSYQKFVWWPGTCREAPCYAAKIGLQAALQTIQSNHPNHWVSLIFYSTPNDSATDTSYGGRFNRARAPLGQNYTRMINALWFPPYTLDNPGSTINPYDYAKNIEVPRAMGGICFAYPLMVAYNQFSSNTSLQTYNPSPAPTGDAGGLGRKS